MQPKLNNEGETPKQEKVEPKESKAKEKSEVKAYAKTIHDLKANEPLPNEHIFKK